MSESKRVDLSFWQIWNMSFGFLGIQYGFGLQQANISPIFRYLGAEEYQIPILWLAGPITGLLVQPIIGALSDGTWTRFGRRKPYFLVGALVGSVAVLCMPYSPYLWVAVGLFWILDAGMNTAMEPYRALVGDKLNRKQLSFGYSVQTFMIAVGQIAAGMMPLILLWFGVSSEINDNEVPDIIKISFVIGVAAILVSALWTAYTTDEYPPENMEEFEKKRGQKSALSHLVTDLRQAIAEMPKTVQRLGWVYLFVWYAMPLMWQYLAFSIARHCFNAPSPDSPGFVEGAANVGLALSIMSVTTLVMSFVIPSITRRLGNRWTYSSFLFVGGAGFISMLFTNQLNLVLAGMVLVGIGWSAIVTIPYIMTVAAVSKEKIGVYLGLLNAFVCIPQILSMLTIGFIYEPVLGGDPRNALVLVGCCLWLAAIAAMGIPKQNVSINYDQAKQC